MIGLRAGRGLGLIVCLALASVSCQGAAPTKRVTKRPEVSPEMSTESAEEIGADMLGDLLSDRGRVLDIEYRLVRTARMKCGDLVRPHAGAVAASEASFDDDSVRAVAADMVGTDADVRLVHVTPGGSFAKAGLRAGDEVLEIDGQALASGADLDRYLLAEPRASVSVLFRRGESTPQTVQVALDPACPIRFQLVPSASLVPWQSSRLLLHVSDTLVRSVDDDTLAVAMAHQVAHALFDQPTDDAVAAEDRADRIGLELATLSGFDVEGAPRYWEEVAIEHPRLIGPADSMWKPLAWSAERRHWWAPPQHPEIALRLPAIREISSSGPDVER